MRQKRVLLRFVEAVYFIDEHDGAATKLIVRQLCPFDGFANILNACHHRGQANHFGVERVGQQACQRGFADARWPPKDHGVRNACFDGVGQWLTVAQQVALAHHLSNGLRTQPLG